MVNVIPYADGDRIPAAASFLRRAATDRLYRHGRRRSGMSPSVSESEQPSSYRPGRWPTEEHQYIGHQHRFINHKFSTDNDIISHINTGFTDCTAACHQYDISIFTPDAGLSYAAYSRVWSQHFTTWRLSDVIEISIAASYDGIVSRNDIILFMTAIV